MRYRCLNDDTSHSSSRINSCINTAFHDCLNAGLRYACVRHCIHSAADVSDWREEGRREEREKMSRGEERGTSGSDVPGCASGSGAGATGGKEEASEKERRCRERERGGEREERECRRYGRWSDRDELNERACCASM